MKIATVIVTYDKVAHAKVQMEIIKIIWKQFPHLKNVDIYHVFNGRREWYPKRYLEKKLIRVPSQPHFEGAAGMIDQGIQTVLKSGIKYDYIMVCSADVWITKPQPVAELLETMQQQQTKLATSWWHLPGLHATEWFIVERGLAEKIFPLNFGDFSYSTQVLKYVTQLVSRFPFLKPPLVEACFTLKINKGLQESSQGKSARLLNGRKFIHFQNRFVSEELGYTSQHDLKHKMEILPSDADQILAEAHAPTYLKLKAALAKFDQI